MALCKTNNESTTTAETHRIIAPPTQGELDDYALEPEPYEPWDTAVTDAIVATLADSLKGLTDERAIMRTISEAEIDLREARPEWLKWGDCASVRCRADHARSETIDIHCLWGHVVAVGLPECTAMTVHSLTGDEIAEAIARAPRASHEGSRITIGRHDGMKAAATAEIADLAEKLIEMHDDADTLSEITRMLDRVRIKSACLSAAAAEAATSFISPITARHGTRLEPNYARPNDGAERNRQRLAEFNASHPELPDVVDIVTSDLSPVLHVAGADPDIELRHTVWFADGVRVEVRDCNIFDGGRSISIDDAPHGWWLETVDGVTRWHTPDGPRDARPESIAATDAVYELHRHMSVFRL